MLVELLIYFLIAVCGAFALIVVSKFVMNAFMRKPNDYYTSQEDAQEELMLKNVSCEESVNHELTVTVKPSMKMKKDELVAIAKEMNIDLPNKVTKQQIIDLINEGK